MLDLDYLDLVFDCDEIDKLDVIKDNSVDVITLTNVLHHLTIPIAFLNRAAAKLKSGGKIIATESLFSALSTPIFKHLHPEPVDFHISESKLQRNAGVAGSANIALPWLIFFRRRD
jgi:ubiquinone/menaquinone biosynthesis C-methylase UbiE